MGKMVNCTRISVDCVENDPVDIRCGGPGYLGFDFNVAKEQKDEMKEYIVETLVQYKVPVLSIYASGDMLLSEEKVWTREAIKKVIQNAADDLIEEASRDPFHK